MSEIEKSGSPNNAQEFARWIVAKLNAAGHQALLAGGCVRDRLLGKNPKDYDVATSATPEVVREIFGYRRTIAVGAAFGVITVVGDKVTGNVEVATFRCDGGYSDGRHPDQVTYSNAEHDAQRRDFTINGLFYDPLSDQVIDYVNGQTDLRARVIRAIGRPGDRFHEDHLRMLRAVRFATVLNFEIEPETLIAIRTLAHEIRTVSGERIAAEMYRLLSSPYRGRGLSLLADSGLWSKLLPQWTWSGNGTANDFPATCARVSQLPPTSAHLEVTLAVIALRQVLASESGLGPVAWDSVLSRVAARLAEVVRGWKLSNDSKAVFRAVQLYLGTIARAPELPWSQLQPVLVAPKIREVLDITEGLTGEALSPDSGFISQECIDLCRTHLERPLEELNPLPLLSGDELKARGLVEGPQLGRCLLELRRKQLDGELASAEAAWEWVKQQRASEPK
jgi:poly(A) polymerase